MHIHGHHVLVLSRDGVAVEGALWLDTVDVRPGETWRVAFVADNPGLWMDHCHNLEHAARRAWSCTWPTRASRRRSSSAGSTATRPSEPVRSPLLRSRRSSSAIGRSASLRQA